MRKRIAKVDGGWLVTDEIGNVWFEAAKEKKLDPKTSLKSDSKPKNGEDEGEGEGEGES